MTLKPFYLNTIRRNWERSAATLPVRSPDRLGAVQPPTDVYLVGAQLLERLDRQLRDAFPSQQAAIAPFRMRVASCFERLRAQAHSGEAATADLAVLRQQLAAAFADLEDICEAFMRAPR